jgi:cytochrome d ubiquinol oxidase subunit I
MILLLAATPLPYLANELGWIGTEVGRQPWVIYGVMRTSDASSTAVPRYQVVLSLALISVFYTLLLVVFLRKFLPAVREGRSTIGEEA